MNSQDLDHIYTHLCKRMSELGEPQAKLFLARFALLSISHIKDRSHLLDMIEQAADFQNPKTSEA